MKIITENIFCDICGNEIKGKCCLNGTFDRQISLTNIVAHKFNRGVCSPDHICNLCQDAILKTIEDLGKAGGRQVTEGWRLINWKNI